MGNFRIVIILIFGFSVFTLLNEYKSKQDQTRMINAATAAGGAAAQLVGVPKSCENKNYCITVYVAPWCPACKSTQPTFKAMNEHLPRLRPDVGFGVIVGAGSKSENNQEKAILSPIETIVDDSGSIMKARKIAAFPTWIVNDKNGKEVFRRSAGLSGATEHDIKLILTQFLGI